MHRLYKWNNDDASVWFIYSKALLVYACESYELTKADMVRINFAWNSMFWKIFKVNDVNIINHIIDFTGRVAISVELYLKRYKFFSKLFTSSNAVQRMLAFCFVHR